VLSTLIINILIILVFIEFCNVYSKNISSENETKLTLLFQIKIVFLVQYSINPVAYCNITQELNLQEEFSGSHAYVCVRG
jgi:hypothetical protein